MTATIGQRGIVLLILTAVVPYLNALPNDFTLDDHGLILSNASVASFDLATMWSGDYWAGYDTNARSGLYRPLTLTSFAVEYAVFGPSPLPYHLTNLLLHLAVTILAWRLFLRFTNDNAALWGAALFAVLPGHSEAVIAVAGRADLLATLASLVALWIWSGARTTGSTLTGALCFALGLLAKEQAIVVPALLLCIHWWQHQRQQRTWHWQPYGMSALVTLVYLLIRYSVLGGVAGLDVEPLDNPLVNLAGLERMVAALTVATRYAGLLIAPNQLSADYSFAAIDVSDLPLLDTVAGLLLAAGALAAAWRFLRQPDTFGLAMMWLVICFAPLINVLFPIGTIMAERISYAPSVGYALGCGWVMSEARRRLGWPLLRSLGSALLLVLAVRTAVRCSDWRDELSLFRAVVAVHPKSAKGHKGLATALADVGRVSEAEQHYREAIDIYPRFDTAHYNLGRLLFGTMRYDEALFHFERACVLRPVHAGAHLNRGVVLFQLGRLQQAMEATRAALVARPNWDMAQDNLRDIEAAHIRVQAADRRQENSE